MHSHLLALRWFLIVVLLILVPLVLTACGKHHGGY
jgi:hypothetical protein